MKHAILSLKCLDRGSDRITPAKRHSAGASPVFLSQTPGTQNRILSAILSAILVAILAVLGPGVAVAVVPVPRVRNTAQFGTRQDDL